MANEEHKELAHFLKEVHSKLRKSSQTIGPEQAWQNHCKDKIILQRYAQYMEKLATTHWENNCADTASAATSRIAWVTHFCYDYFINKLFLKYKRKEIEIAKKINITLTIEETYTGQVKLLDVGSCYNPFLSYSYFDVTAIDIFPANASVLECDFLNVSIGSVSKFTDCKILQLQKTYYDVVTFCFLLEYIPSSELRIKACKNAYTVLKPGGLLIIITPDSKHVGANYKIMKCWQFTLAKLGFMRIKYEKLTHMHCMVFRRALCRDTAARWALLHQEPYMKYALHIPQDYSNDDVEALQSTTMELETVFDDFKELPFCEPSI